MFRNPFRKHHIDPHPKLDNLDHVRFLDGLTFSDKIEKNNMSYQLIYRKSPCDTQYLGLRESLENNHLVIEEVSTGGSVPQLKCKNQSDHYVLILAGEEIIGAKQNRVINVPFIIGPKSETEIPVSCVEQGRWSYDTPQFCKGEHAYTDLRRKVVEDVSYNAISGLGYGSDQGRVWDDISEKETIFRRRSQTGAMNEMYSHFEEEMRDILEGFDTKKSYGICVYINEGLAGVDIMPSSEFFSEISNDVLQGYLLESIRLKNEKSPFSTFRSVESFIQYTSKVPASITDGVGLGKVHNIHSKGIVGHFLKYENDFAHGNLFPREISKGR